MNETTKQVGASTGIGIAAGQIVVWLLETFLLADPIPSTVAVAIGTVLVGAIHYLKERAQDESFNDISPGGTG